MTGLPEEAPDAPEEAEPPPLLRPPPPPLLPEEAPDAPEEALPATRRPLSVRCATLTQQEAHQPA